MRILWFNWRDIKNPEAGGAEVFTHEVCKRLVKQSEIESVTLFASSFDGAKENETIDGIKIIRKGNKYSVYKKAREYYRQNENECDIVIDEINTKPFMTPDFVRGKPIVALIHQLAREFWFYETPFPINILGYLFLEKHWLQRYTAVPTIAVSKSTQEDLLEWGFRNVSIVPEGIGFKALDKPAEKELVPTVIFVGRLKRAKKPDDAIRAFKVIKDEIPEAKLWVVGDGYMMPRLQKLVQSLFRDKSSIAVTRSKSKVDDIRDNAEGAAKNHSDLVTMTEVPLSYDDNNKDSRPSSVSSSDIVFFGKIDASHKLELMSRAHLLLVPGVREGWGLVVTEANAMGTPAIAYDVHGLRDSVVDGMTGALVSRDDPVAMAIEAVELFKDRRKLKSYSINAIDSARTFDWDKTTDHIVKILNKSISSSSHSPSSYSRTIGSEKHAK